LTLAVDGLTPKLVIDIQNDDLVTLTHDFLLRNYSEYDYCRIQNFRQVIRSSIISYGVFRAWAFWPQKALMV